jgi:hypothetical protein
LNLLEGLECDKSLNLIHFIALWPNFHNFYFFCYSFVLCDFKWAPLATLIVTYPKKIHLKKYKWSPHLDWYALLWTYPMIFQRRIIRKIHCCCMEGGVYDLKKVYSLHYFHPIFTWHKTWIIMRWNFNVDALIVVKLSTKWEHLECSET